MISLIPPLTKDLPFADSRAPRFRYYSWFPGPRVSMTYERPIRDGFPLLAWDRTGRE